MVVPARHDGRVPSFLWQPAQVHGNANRLSEYERVDALAHQGLDRCFARKSSAMKGKRDEPPGWHPSCS
jgi:hypothetical protein